MVWMKESKNLSAQAKVLARSRDIRKQREAFFLISESLISVVKQFGTGGRQAVFQFHCPTVFGGRGADWLQNTTGVRNPYFGPAMPRCGEQTAILISGRKSAFPAGRSEGHGE